jgi:hypothetical protein
MNTVSHTTVDGEVTRATRRSNRRRKRGYGQTPLQFQRDARVR